MAKPTFLCIGAQRCGTTRLHRILSAHPEVLMTNSGVDKFEKEIHYFDRLVVDRPLSWYENHFSTSSVTGEITPAYSTLSDKVIADISRYLPEVRLIFIIRHLFERIWSQICMMRSEWGRMGKMHPMDLMKLIEVAESPAVTLRSDYLRTIRNWKAFFPRDQLLVVRFEKLLQQEGLSQVLNHIGVNPNWCPPASKAEKVWSAVPADMPQELRWWISLRWLEMIRDLYAWGADIQDWVLEIEAQERLIPSSFRSQSLMLRRHAQKSNQQKWRDAVRRDDDVRHALHKRLLNPQN